MNQINILCFNQQFFNILWKSTKLKACPTQNLFPPPNQRVYRQFIRHTSQEILMKTGVIEKMTNLRFTIRVTSEEADRNTKNRFLGSF